MSKQPSKTNKLVPNAFQIPNVIVDRYERYLTPEEFKLLVWTYRHIYGWQDKIDERCRDISVSTFVDGIGEKYGPCGLKRNAVLRAIDGLCTYGLLVKVGEPSKNGQKYRIPNSEKEIDYESLRKRLKKKAILDKKRTVVAVKKLGIIKSEELGNSTGLSDKPLNSTGLSDKLVVCATNQDRFVGQTETGLSDKHTQSQLTKPTIHIQDAPQNGADKNTAAQVKSSEPNNFEKLIDWWYKCKGECTPPTPPPYFNHRRFTDIVMDRINGGRTWKQISEAMRVYWRVVKSPLHYYTHKVNISRFIGETIDDFWDGDEAWENFKDKKKNANSDNGKKVVAPWEKPWNPLEQKGLVQNAATPA